MNQSIILIQLPYSETTNLILVIVLLFHEMAHVVNHFDEQ